MGNFVGIDLHKKVSQLATLREPKPASQVRFPNHTVTVEKVLKKLPQGSKIALYAKRNIDAGMIFHRVRPPAFRAEDLSGYGPRIVEEDVALLGFLNRVVQGLDKELKAIAEKDPESKRLMTIPGVGPVNAVAGSCWIGTIERFSNSKKLSSYFGLAPRVRQSGERERHGHITKEGNRMVRS